MEHEKEAEKKLYHPEHKTHENSEHKVHEHHEHAMHDAEHTTHKPKEKPSKITRANWILLGVFALFILLNQYQVYSLDQMTGGHSSFSYGGDDLSDVDISTITSTAQGIAILFPIDQIKTEEDAIAVMIPTGTPDYGTAMGVSYDDPVTALDLTKNAYPTLKAQAQTNPQLWARYLALAAAPRGISCEFCCGVGAQGITSD